TTYRAGTGLVLHYFRMHGAGVFCLFLCEGRCFHQVHAANRTTSGLIVGFISFTMHRAVINAATVTGNYLVCFFMIRSMVIIPMGTTTTTALLFLVMSGSLYPVMPSIIFECLLQFFQRNMIFHFYFGFGLLQIYGNSGNAFHFLQNAFYVIFTTSARHPGYF